MTHLLEKTTFLPLSVKASFSLHTKSEHHVHSYTFSPTDTENSDTIEGTKSHVSITESETTASSPTNNSAPSSNNDDKPSNESNQLLQLVDLIEKAKAESNQYLTQMISQYGQGVKIDHAEEEIEDEDMENEENKRNEEKSAERKHKQSKGKQGVSAGVGGKGQIKGTSSAS